MEAFLKILFYFAIGSVIMMLARSCEPTAYEEAKAWEDAKAWADCRGRPDC